MHNVLFVQFEFLPTKKAVTYLKLFGPRGPLDSYTTSGGPPIETFPLNTHPLKYLTYTLHFNFKGKANIWTWV